MQLENTLRYIDEHMEGAVSDLMDFLRIPSISTSSDHAADMRTAAEWVRIRLEKLGFASRTYDTKRWPVVYGERCRVSGAPTLLVYGHYDVQPPEPLEEWISPPFEPAIRDGEIFARGANDDKGQFYTHILAVEALLAANEELPINVKFVVEGEEEIGSKNLAVFLKEYRDILKADAFVVSDSSQFAAGVPAVTYGLRGIACLQLEIQGAKFDLHSGLYGGGAPNAPQALADILASLKTPDGKVAIPGFYDRVLPLEDWERREMAALNLSTEDLADSIGAPGLIGESGYSPLERKTARPTLEINGVWGGFAGEGTKTVIPSKAGAKISMRLAPNQDPDEIFRLFEDYVDKVKPAAVTASVQRQFHASPVLVERDNRFVKTASEAIAKGFGRKPVFLRTGGSIPIVNLVKDQLGVEPLLILGWGRPENRSHSPNERFSLDDFRMGARSAAILIAELADSD
ncbi:MAG: dipeptidase [Desulfovibrionaceae bacterium]